MDVTVFDTFCSSQDCRGDVCSSSDSKDKADSNPNSSATNATSQHVPDLLQSEHIDESLPLSTFNDVNNDNDNDDDDESYGSDESDDDEDDDDIEDDDMDGNEEYNDVENNYDDVETWPLPLLEQVIKNAKLICIYTLNALTEKGKGPVTLSEKDNVDRRIHLGRDIVVRAYTLYKEKFGENVALFPMGSLHSIESGVYVLQRANGESKVG
jgi:hypothetical protein